MHIRMRRYGAFVPAGATHTGPMTVEVPRAVEAAAAALARQRARGG